MPPPSTSDQAHGPDDRRILETLTADSEQRTIASVILRLAALRRTDRAHPRVRHWGVPAFCAALGISSYLNPYNTGDVPAQLALIVALTVPLLWRERRPMLVFTLTTAASVTALPLGVLTGAESARVPAGLDPVAMASASDNWSLTWRLVAPHLKNRPGARVLVVARGSIGLYVCDIARALGASDVLYVDPDPGHRRIAEGYGARTAEAIEPVRHGFDLAVEATGRVDQLALAVTSLAPEGICESAGNHFRPGELPLLDMYLTEHVPPGRHPVHRPGQRPRTFPTP